MRVEPAMTVGAAMTRRGAENKMKRSGWSMWMSKRQAVIGREGSEEMAGPGVATMGGNPAAVYLGTERRALPIYSAGGLRWMPEVGDSLLVVKQGDCYCVAGREVKPEETAALKPGEMMLAGPDCSVTLKQGGRAEHRGTAVFSDRVELGGAVYWNGRELEQRIRDIVIGVLSTI